MEIIRNNAVYKKLRKEYVKFVYHSYSYSFSDKTRKEMNISFKFQLISRTGKKDVEFNPSSSITIPNSFSFYEKKDLENLVFHVGMAELISYWKAACPKIVEIKPFNLTSEQMNWWKNVYYLGMQEFFYLNAINPPDIEGFMSITSVSDPKMQKITYHRQSKRNIIPVGGGKDSIVTLECMKELSSNNLGLIINPRGASLNTFKNAGYAKQDLITIDRQISNKLLELNKEGFPGVIPALNGHTPFSSVLAFYCLLASYLSNAGNIVLSNESSANESTVIGTNINHQYSKSYEFEEDFRSYTHKYIWGGSNYYSFLRPLNELQIASIFSAKPKHFFEFKSCNVGSKKNVWCGKCAKCLFTYIILSPFVEPKVLFKIFGKELFGDKNLMELFQQLIGNAETKPFECVGTVEEVNVAIAVAIERFYKKKSLPYLLNYYSEQGYVASYKMQANKLLEEFNDKNNLPENYSNYLLAAKESILNSIKKEIQLA